jgi:oxygen-independent coproporphyrinogen III oxidase
VEASLYLHVPFCAGACDYCDFYSVRCERADPRQDAFVDRILAEIEAGLDREGIDAVPTLFIGGGTPTLLGAPRLKRLLEGTLALCPTRPAEITVEANPESLSEAVVAALAEGGADRISLGLQSLNQRSRAAVCRIGSIESSIHALDLISKTFTGRFSVDLIAGLPFQDDSSLRSDIRRVLDSGAAHVSLYSLILEEGTPLAERAGSGVADLPDEERSDTLWIEGRDALEEAGLAQYEVSNFARPGEECRHNLRYWRMESWLGFGPAASGTLVDEAAGTARRVTVPPDVDAWLAGKTVSTEEAIDRTALMEEIFMMGFRTLAGVDAVLFKRRFGEPIETFIGNTLASWRRRGLAAEKIPALTREGLLFLDPFVLECLAEMETKTS